MIWTVNVCVFVLCVVAQWLTQAPRAAVIVVPPCDMAAWGLYFRPHQVQVFWAGYMILDECVCVCVCTVRICVCGGI